MSAVLKSIPVDVNGFESLTFHSAEPAMKWDEKTGRPSETDQATDDDGRALYTVSLVVQYRDAYDNKKVDVVDVKTAEARGEDPNSTCTGRAVELRGLVASVDIKQNRAGGWYLQQYLNADSIGPVEAGTRKRTNGTATDTASALLDQGSAK